jgi:hypothetical protein
VNEYIRAAPLWPDKAKALCLIEPLHSSHSHVSIS